MLKLKKSGKCNYMHVIIMLFMVVVHTLTNINKTNN